MKKRILSLTILAFTAFLFVAVGILTAADVPETVVIDSKGYKQDKKGPVTLNHKKHIEEYDVACDECHHVYSDGKNVWKEGDEVKKCDACHNPEKSEGNVKKLQTAFHNNCKNCHKEVGGEAPYKKCNDYHAKK